MHPSPYMPLKISRSQLFELINVINVLCESYRIKRKQLPRGHNIAADGWAGASNPHIHPNPHSCKHRQTGYKHSFWQLKKRKNGYTAILVACGWAGAVLEKVTKASGQEPYAQKAQKRQKK